MGSTSIYATIRELQKSIGIQHDDYARYRRLCSTKIKSIRKSSRPKTKEKGKKSSLDSKYQGKDLKGEDAMVILLLAERCASSALEIRRETALEPRKVYSERKKWSQAIKYSQFLLNTSFDTEQLELLREYYQANCHFAYQQWEDAVIKFRKFLMGIRRLISSVSVSNDLKTYYDKIISDSEALCRYCQHIGGIDSKNLMDIDEISVENNDLRENGTLVSVGGIDWEIEQSYQETFVSAFQNISQISFNELKKNNVPENLILYLRFYSELTKVFDIISTLTSDFKWIYSFDQPIDSRIRILQMKISKVITLLGKLNKCSNVTIQVKSQVNQIRGLLIYCSSVFNSFINGNAITTSNELGSSCYSAFPAASFDLNSFKENIVNRIVKLNEAKKNLKLTEQRITRFGVSAPALENKATILEDYMVPRIPFDGKKDLINNVFIPQTIPMKPVFYDVAFELLEPPKL